VFLYASKNTLGIYWQQFFEFEHTGMDSSYYKYRYRGMTGEKMLNVAYEATRLH